MLKCEQGFVGYKSPGSTRLECNKAAYATIQVNIFLIDNLWWHKHCLHDLTQVERAENGQVHLKGENGKYWQVADGGVACDSSTPHGFYLELREPTRMCIKNSNGQYLVEQKNGGFTIGSTDPEDATRWWFSFFLTTRRLIFFVLQGGSTSFFQSGAEQAWILSEKRSDDCETWRICIPPFPAICIIVPKKVKLFAFPPCNHKHLMLQSFRRDSQTTHHSFL